jgi:glycosyltransferase involved in cell wall biosynthesis
VPSFNQGRFIRATLDSILEQDYRPIEIHVIDGGSTDETLEVLRSYGDIPELQWVSESDSGVVEAVNKGFARARGEIIGIQSSDDCYLPGAISRVVKEFRSNREFGLVYGDTVKVDAEGRELLRTRIGPWSLENLFLLKTWIPQPSAFFRKELLDICGGWDERIPYAPDTDLWIRMAFRTKVLKLDAWLSQRRVHDAQRDLQAARILGDYQRMIMQSRDIASAPSALKRAARASGELMYRRYNPTGSEIRAFWHDLTAMVICPKAFDACRLWAYGVVLPLRRFLRPLAPVKRWLGCWANERWRTELALMPLGERLGHHWRDLCNRHEKIMWGDDSASRLVSSEFTSYLTVASTFPKVGGRLARKCFAEHPLPRLVIDRAPVYPTPRVSVILPVSGSDRIPGFAVALSGLANQSLREIEIVVLEHSPFPEYITHVPEGVSYEHIPYSETESEFNKSMLLNRGVELAKAPVVLLHDADILVPRDYLSLALKRIEAGFEAIRPLRFLFYLDQGSTSHLIDEGALSDQETIDRVAQNSQGGSTLIRKTTYRAIGGHDERFLGWGGEDLEFLERLRTQRLFRGGFMPALHLWHPPALNKASGGRNQRLLSDLRSQTPAERIQRLVATRSCARV